MTSSTNKPQALVDSARGSTPLTNQGMKTSFTQTSGLIARRMISYASVGDKVSSTTTILARKIES